MKKIKLLSIISFIAIALFSGCKNDSDSENTADPKTTPEPETYVLQSKNSCGAYSLAYYLAETGQISVSNIETKAEEIYQKVKFDESAGMGEYSDPVKIVEEILKNGYAKEAEMKMTASSNPTPAESVLTKLASNFGITDYKTFTSVEAGLGKNQYLIEIVVPDPDQDFTSHRIYLHYILTYWKDGNLVTRDPGRGDEVLRSSLEDGTNESYLFCNGGIVITPKTN